MKNSLEEIIKKKKDRVKVGNDNIVQDSWIMEEEEQLGFPFPKTYKEFIKKYEFIELGYDIMKIIAPPDFREYADIDILYTYKVNIENEILQENQVSILENEEEIYYFLVQDNIIDNEYSIYRKDFINNSDEFFAENFNEFLVLKIEEL